MVRPLKKTFLWLQLIQNSTIKLVSCKLERKHVKVFAEKPLTSGFCTKRNEYIEVNF